MFGAGAGTYAAEPIDAAGCRLVCRFVLSCTGVGRLRAPLLATGDLVMVRKQFHTFRALAEHDAATGRAHGWARHMTDVDDLPRYRVLTGPDDATFCWRVSEALDLGYDLYGSPALTFDGERVIVA